MNANVLLMVASLCYLIVILILYFPKKKVNTFETRIYKYILIFAVFGVVMDLIGVYVSLHVDDTSVIRWIVLKLYYSYLLTIMYLLTLYMFISNGASELTKKENTKINIISVIYVIVLAINSILPVNYYKDGNVIYAYGIGTNYLYLVTGLIIFIWICWWIKDIKKLRTRRNIPMIILVILAIPIIYLQMTNPQLLLVSSLISFIVVIMYHTIENPDVKMINELNLAKDTAEKANRAKSDFLSSMSHEIRTPLNAIVGFSECIKNADSLEEAKEDASDVITASNTLLEIVNGILDISKIEAGKLELVETDYEVKKLFKEIVRLIQARIGDKQLDFRVNIAEDIPDILYGDHANVKKIVINLLTNAVKYTDQGYVSLDVKCVNKNGVCRLFISVKDSGRGIKQEDMSKLFTKFQRVEEDRNTTIEGTGLGLAITKQLVDMMNGNIVVTSQYKEGSEFKVAIDQKISTSKLDTPKEEIEDLNLDLTNKRILIVDDNKLNLKVGQKLLAKYNPIIDTAESGMECLEKIKSGKEYDLILLDDMMPKMRGREVLIKLKENPKYKTPTVALTANAINGVREQYLKDGFDDYLAKPIDKEQLNKILTKYLKKDYSKKIDENDSKKEAITKKVLLVDDNKINIDIAKNFLKEYNFTIESCLSGRECLNLIKSGKEYDLIFVDIMMPEMDGIELFKLLKSDVNFNGKIVALTADAVEGAKEKYINIGFDGYIPKPINKKVLNDVIINVLNEKYETSKVEPKAITKSEEYLKENGIDIDKSLELLGDINTYNDLLKDFIATIKDKSNQLNDYREKNDMDNYAIIVHGLKSDSRYLGFTKLAEMALEHELRSKDKDIDYINSHFVEILKEITRVVGIVNKYLNIIIV